MKLFIQQASTRPNEGGEGDVIVDKTTKDPISLVNFKHRADGKIELRFLEESTAVAVGSIELSVKHTRDFNGTLMAYSNSFTLVGSLSEGYYTGYPSFDVSTLNAFFNTGNLPYLDFGMEISWLSGGHRSSTIPITARIWNNYVKAADSGITPPVGVTGLSVVTGILNGPGLGVTNMTTLGAFTTAGINDRIICIPDSGTSFTFWRLRSGTEATDTALGFKRPDDYAAASNEKVWVGFL